MPTLAQLRVPHPFRPHRKAWGIALCATALSTLASPKLQAQSSSDPCKLGTISENIELTYPPIAKAARVTGNVILIASFAPDGTVASVQTISGPLMLQGRATDYVRGWKASPLPGVRTCPIVIEFRTVGQERRCDEGKPAETQVAFTPLERRDSQHVTITFDRGQYCYMVQYSTNSKGFGA